MLRKEIDRGRLTFFLHVRHFLAAEKESGGPGKAEAPMSLPSCLGRTKMVLDFGLEIKWCVVCRALVFPSGSASPKTSCCFLRGFFGNVSSRRSR